MHMDKYEVKRNICKHRKRDRVRTILSETLSLFLCIIKIDYLIFTHIHGRAFMFLSFTGYPAALTLPNETNFASL